MVQCPCLVLLCGVPRAPARALFKGTFDLGPGMMLNNKIALAFLGPIAAFGSQEPLYYINAPDVICSGAVATVTVNSPDQLTREGLHIPTIWRSSPRGVVIQFDLVDANNKSIFGTQTVELDDFTASGRRLDTPSPEPQDDVACEGFYLLDGRNPVDLPDTWNEARLAFGDICNQEETDPSSGKCAASEERIFAGYPTGEGAFEADDKLCKRLMEHANEKDLIRGRRLKGGPTHGNYDDRRSRVVVGDFGASSTLYGMWRFSRMSGSGGSSDSDAPCEHAQLCIREIDGTQLFYDELLKLAFKPTSYVYPLKFIVQQLTHKSKDNMSAMCPPPNWRELVADGRWAPPSEDSFFVSMAAVEPAVAEEGGGGGASIGVWSTVKAAMVCGAVGCIMVLVLGIIVARSPWGRSQRTATACTALASQADGVAEAPSASDASLQQLITGDNRAED
uniref:Uncharacterized protein n=1 Tax=Zooxanthella nutricula TaxID=1333877 RepID=A0A7S2K4J8_9DINO